ncbi:hypothetical protein NPIL_117191 [Nephila pilipes]|uniref:Uncharacterized protein n=1 Tax=Nephila pilipes TaxID=299642 RepID=A0A8X6TJ74_NEPPI|nr:hypothetical protein NPIL_234421 [Nephila pilipes]GFT44039.1 hypothetical protein NPIL_625301 [Nephila pilipes]GFT91646.1 hypothetical protein NPIL_150411 [Nephila pilipes]GFU43637.1 hypothetical protein NPIL_117191 [Nephila pilipes]
MLALYPSPVKTCSLSGRQLPKSQTENNKGKLRAPLSGDRSRSPDRVRVLSDRHFDGGGMSFGLLSGCSLPFPVTAGQHGMGEGGGKKIGSLGEVFLLEGV